MDKTDLVVLTMARADYNLLMVALGYATAAAGEGGRVELEEAFVKLVNRLNKDSPEPVQ